MRQPTAYHIYESYPLNVDAPRPPPFSNDLHSGSDYDVVMTGGTNTRDDNQPPAGSQVPTKVSRRSRHGNLDWEAHKDELKELYLNDNWSLKDTMRVMKQKYSFPES